MKFKKIEIQAFRAYDKPGDGIFDFSLPDAGIANFVSIYAPNGFGKTSFYDAVEYGMTKNISRFLRKSDQNKDAVKSERTINKKKKQYILRNRFSHDSEIKIFTTGSTEPIVTKIEKPKKNAGSDFTFDSKHTEHQYFQTVILSQEWIDAFLREDEPEGRYEKFISFFGDRKLDEYYRKIVELIQYVDKVVADLNKKSRELAAALKYNGDKEILTKINEHIKILNSRGNKIPVITGKYSSKESVNLTNLITEKLSTFRSAIEKNKTVIKAINSALVGNDSIPSLQRFIEAKAQLADNLKAIKELETALLLLKDIEKQNAELDKVNKEAFSFSESIQLALSIQGLFEEYGKNAKKIADIEKTIQNLNSGKQQIQFEINSIDEKIKIETKRLDQFRKILNEETQKLKGIPATRDQISNAQKIRDKDQGRLAELRNLEIALRKKIGDLEKEIESWNNFKDDVTQNISDLSSTVMGGFANETSDLFRLSFDLQRLNQRLTAVAQRLEQQKEFNNQLETFISQGSDIVNQTKADSCPLCTTKFDSFQSLQKAISNNEFLSTILNDLLIEKNTIDAAISLAQNQLDAKRSALLISINTKVGPLNEELNTSKNALFKTIQEIKALENAITSVDKRIEQFRKDLGSISVSDAETIQNQKIEACNQSIDQSSQEIAILQSQLIGKNEELKENTIKTDTELLSQNELKVNVNYQKVLDFFRTTLNSNDPKSTDLLSWIKKQRENAEKTVAKQNNIKETLEKSKLLVPAANQAKVTADLNELKHKRDQVIKLLNTFNSFLLEQAALDISKLGDAIISTELRKEESDILETNRNLEQSIAHFELLNSLKQNVEPYLTYAKALEEKNEIAHRIECLTKKVRIHLEEERIKISEHLDSQISNFFYQDLINDLYRRIDPHPDYTSISFKCDFTNDKPKLNVCVQSQNKGNDEEFIIPNLYFSTAQLNILSLAIFLAKALNVVDNQGKSVDCIFIDDPIQSMDSINILSTIDLIRSLVVKTGKQIILSTHDENFHNLLKKKIPTGYFQSKFIELEAYGKVRREPEIAN